MKMTINDPDGLLHAQLQEWLKTGIALSDVLMNLMHSINENAQGRGYTNGVAWAKAAIEAGEITAAEMAKLQYCHTSRNLSGHGHAGEVPIEEEDCIFLLSILPKLEKSKLHQNKAELDAPKNWEETVNTLKEAAEGGSAEAMFQLGASYVSLDNDSHNCAEDRLEAGRWFLRAAMRGVTAAPIYDNVVSHCLNTALWNMTSDLLEDLRNCSAQGYVQASKYLSLCYKDGYGVERNEQEQFRYTQIAAEQGDSESQRIVAMASETKSKEKGKRKTKEEKEAEAAKKMELLFEAAEKGDIPAQYEIGCLYAKGRKGVKKNAEEAFKWYKKAADGHYDVAAHISVREPIEAAHRKACYEVALCYENGICVEKDYKKAIGYYFYANEADLPDEAKAEVNYKVGHAYVTGDLGIRKPYSAAKYHLEIAAKLGHQQAKKELPGVRLKSMFEK